MKIAIIETGKPPEIIRDAFPDYPAMFRELLGRAGARFEYVTFDVDKDELPTDTSEFDGLLITGSPAGVYEDHEWMPSLFKLIEASVASNTPQIGICFGHQAVAQALGGKVIKSPKGWALGRHEYAFESPEWLTISTADSFALAASHQDQVVIPPEGAAVIASSDFCEFAGLYLADGPALTFQGHPEFEADFSIALSEARRGTKLSDEQVDATRASYQKPLDSLEVGRWMVAFFEQFGNSRSEV